MAMLGTNDNLSEHDNIAALDVTKEQDRLTSNLTDTDYWPEQIDIDKL